MTMIYGWTMPWMNIMVVEWRVGSGLKVALCYQSEDQIRLIILDGTSTYRINELGRRWPTDRMPVMDDDDSSSYWFIEDKVLCGFATICHIIVAMAEIIDEQLASSPTWWEDCQVSRTVELMICLWAWVREWISCWSPLSRRMTSMIQRIYRWVFSPSN